MTSHEYDLVVVGAGPGGYVAAIRAAQLGLNVACVEKEPALGGTCLRVGCIPSKALLDSTERFYEAKRTFGDHGLRLEGLSFDLAAMQQRKGHVVSMLTKGVEALFKKNKVVRYLGRATLAGNGIVKVEAQPPVELKARHILIATGSKPASLSGIEFHGQEIGTSTEALAYDQVPGHLVVIGAGYIGLELGSVWNRLGVQVTVLEYFDRILPGLDTELATEARKLFEKQGLQLRLGIRVTGARCEDGQCVVECEGQEPIHCDRVLVAAGRVPNTVDLGLEALGVETTEKGFVRVNEHFATNVAGVYAVGDVIGGAMLAHKAEEEGVACVEQLVTGYGHVNYQAIAGVVYTSPEIATVGKTEDQLKTEGVEYHKGTFPFRANGRARALGHTEGFVKVLADARTDRVLGVHILGPHAGDLINEAAVAIAFDASSEDLARSCHVHPTLGEALREAALGVAGRSIHL